jgi:hypothetical protein
MIAAAGVVTMVKRVKSWSSGSSKSTARVHSLVVSRSEKSTDEKKAPMIHPVPLGMSESPRDISQLSMEQKSPCTLWIILNGRKMLAMGPWTFPR